MSASLVRRPPQGAAIRDSQASNALSTELLGAALKALVRPRVGIVTMPFSALGDCLLLLGR